MSTAALHVTKLAAAKRQIQAAIRLFFLDEDELAIHTVASAAYGLLKDLKRDRGQSEAADIYRTAFFYVVRDFRRGTLPAHFTSDPSIMAEVERIADQLFFITADSRLPDVTLTIPQDVEKQYWNENNRAANFLKHADRDTDGTLSLERIDNHRLILKCCSAYQDIAPDDLGNEELAFAAFTAAGNPSHQATGSDFDSLVESMRRVPSEHRLQRCYKVIIELNAS